MQHDSFYVSNLCSVQPIGQSGIRWIQCTINDGRRSSATVTLRVQCIFVSIQRKKWKNTKTKLVKNHFEHLNWTEAKQKNQQQQQRRALDFNRFLSAASVCEWRVQIKSTSCGDNKQTKCSFLLKMFIKCNCFSHSIKHASIFDRPSSTVYDTHTRGAERCEFAWHYNQCMRVRSQLTNKQCALRIF